MGRSREKGAPLVVQKQEKERREWEFTPRRRNFSATGRMVKLEWVKKRLRTSVRSKQPVQFNSGSRRVLVRRPRFLNKPLSNFDLFRWIDFLGIPGFKGIFARDEHMPKEHSSRNINLDSYERAGTHWVCCVPSNETKNTLWYFDSFGMSYPKEFKARARKDGMQVIYNSSQYQNINSVLCGYFCLFFLHQWSMGKNFYDILYTMHMQIFRLKNGNLLRQRETGH